MNKIYKTKWNQYIDLSTIVTLSLENQDNRLILVMSCKGVDDSIVYAFKDKKDIKHTLMVEGQVNDLVEAWKEYKESKELIMTTNFITRNHPCDICENKNKHQGISRCNKKVVNENGIHMFLGNGANIQVKEVNCDEK